MFNYQQLIEEFNVKSIQELNTLFWDEIALDWVVAYKDMSTHGTVTLQNFCGYSYVIDDGNQLEVHNTPETTEMLEGRVVGAFGISTQNVMKENRKIMRK